MVNQNIHNHEEQSFECWVSKHENIYDFCIFENEMLKASSFDHKQIFISSSFRARKNFFHSSSSCFYTAEEAIIEEEVEV